MCYRCVFFRTIPDPSLVLGLTSGSAAVLSILSSPACGWCSLPFFFLQHVLPAIFVLVVLQLSTGDIPASIC